RILDLRGRVALESEHGIIAHHATPVVGNLDQFFSTSFYVDLDARRTRVQRVLEQLLHHRGGPLHDFAGGDLVGNVLGKNVNAAHAESVQWSVSQMAAAKAKFIHEKTTSGKQLLSWPFS